MPLFYFNVRDGHDFPDTEGTLLDDVSEVRREAVRAASEILKGWQGDTDWQMNVTDEAGEPVLGLRFSINDASAKSSPT
jgi:hypothetical protein